MKELPILFSTSMVQALLEGRKTQTRRIVKPQPQALPELPLKLTDFCNEMKRLTKEKTGLLHTAGAGKGLAFPDYRWAAGDLLYVRETWAQTHNTNRLETWPNRPHIVTDDWEGEITDAYIYRADGEWQWLDDDGYETDKSCWKPSIHMPKAAARIWLQVKEVRVERLQDISEIDALREGVDFHDWREFNTTSGQGTRYKAYRNYLKPLGSETSVGKYDCFNLPPIKSFTTLWQSINGLDSWNRNDWVFVISYEVISTTGRAAAIEKIGKEVEV